MITNQLQLAFSTFADDLDEEYTPPPEILAKARVSPPLVQALREYYAAARTADPQRRIGQPEPAR
jgi:glycine oxidase